MSSELPLRPYCGLNSFTLRDKNIFAGRKQEVQTALKLILQYRGIIIYGSSGIGKSSLIAAGLLPKVFSEKIFSAELIRINPNEKGTFVITRIRPAEDAPYLPSIFDFLNPDKDGNKINVSYQAFKQVLSRYNNKAKVHQPIPVMIFDQFEELITLFEESGEDEEKIKIQENIIQLLSDCFYDEALKIKFVFIFREDYLAKFDKLLYAIPDLKTFSLYVKPLDKKLLLEVIRRPFDTPEKSAHFKNPFDDDLMQELNKQFLERFKGSSLNLTEVQIVCSQLYLEPPAKRMEYLTTSKVSKILEDFYLDLLEEIPQTRHVLALDILSMLVLNERTRNIVHEDAIVKSLSKYQVDEVKSVLMLFEKSIRIIRRENRQDGAYYEIISEAIIPYINSENKKREQQKEFSDSQKKTYWTVATIFVVWLIVFLGFMYYQSAKTDAAIKKLKAADIMLLNHEMDKMKSSEQKLGDTTVRKGPGNVKKGEEKVKEKDLQMLAYEQYEQAIEEAPINLKVIVFPKMVKMLFEQGEGRKAFEIFRSHVNSDDENAVFFYVMVAEINAAKSNLFFNDYDKPTRVKLEAKFDSIHREVLNVAFQNSIEEDPGFMNYLALSLAEVGMDSLCFITLQRMNDLDDWAVTKLGVYYEEGIGQSIKPDYKKAADLYSKSNNPEYKIKLAGLYFRMEDDDLAYTYLKTLKDYDIYWLGIDFFEKALSSSDTTTKRNNYKYAGKLLEKVESKELKDEYYYHYLGNCYARQKRYADALVTYAKGLEIAPDNPYLLNSSAWWTTKKDPGSAPALKRALEYSAKSVDVSYFSYDRANHLDTKAEILFLMGRYSESLTACKQSQKYIDVSDPSFITSELRNGVPERIEKIKKILKK